MARRPPLESREEHPCWFPAGDDDHPGICLLCRSTLLILTAGTALLLAGSVMTIVSGSGKWAIAVAWIAFVLMLLVGIAATAVAVSRSGRHLPRG